MAPPLLSSCFHCFVPSKEIKLSQCLSLNKWQVRLAHLKKYCRYIYKWAINLFWICFILFMDSVLKGFQLINIISFKYMNYVIVIY